MRAWIASVGIAAVAIHSVASSAGFRTFTDQPLHHAGLFFDRAALLLQGTSSLRRDRTASIERIADFRPDDRVTAYFQNANGVVADVPQTATAFSHRKAIANMMVGGHWQDRSYNEEGRARVCANWEKSRRLLTVTT